jgi:hypothetical protein
MSRFWIAAPPEWTVGEVGARIVVLGRSIVLRLFFCPLMKVNGRIVRPTKEFAAPYGRPKAAEAWAPVALKQSRRTSGTAVAEQDASMKKPQRMPESVGLDEQNLPEAAVEAIQQSIPACQADSQAPVTEVAFGGAMTESPASGRVRSRLNRDRERWIA